MKNGPVCGGLTEYVANGSSFPLLITDCRSMDEIESTK